MALVTIIAVNQTGSSITLTQLYAPNAQIPASGQVTLTDYNRVEEILGDTELLGTIQADQVLLTVDGGALTKEQSLAFLDAPTTPVKVSYGQSSSPPTATDDETQGYSIGSVWITTGGGVYQCTDATATAAAWSQLNASGALAYSDVAATNTTTTTIAEVPVLMNGMSITPPAGTYLVWFNADVAANRNNTEAVVTIYSGGAEAPFFPNRSHLFQASAASTAMTTQTRVTVSGAEAIEGRWYILVGVNSELTATDRSLIILAVETP